MRKLAAIYLIFLIIFSGCRTAKFVPEGEYLLNSVEVNSDNKEVKAADVSSYIKQKPNPKTFGVIKLHLWIYNRAPQNGDGWLARFFKNIGEEPVVYDASSNVRTEREMKRYLANKGFTQAQVSSHITFDEKKKKANVKYKIESKTPYRIAESKISVKDTAILTIINQDSANSLIKEGQRFDLDILDEERERISAQLKDEGYYNFNKNNFYFTVDTGLGQYKVSEVMCLELDTTKQVSYNPYSINKIRFIVGYDAEKALNLGASYLANMDSMFYRDIMYLSEGKIKVKPEILSRNNLLYPGMLYSKTLSDRTHSLLSAIGIIRYVNINYTERGDSLLDCDVYISLAEPQSTNIDLEGTNISGNFGAAANYGFGHKNLFRGAEQFSSNVSVGVEAILGLNNNEVYYSRELGADLKLTYPKFVFPFLRDDFKQKSRAETDFGLSYDYQERPEYERQIATAEMIYKWRRSERIKHELTPVMSNFISIPQMSSSFRQHIDTTEYLKYSYQNHVIFGSRYAISFQGKKDEDRHSSRYVRLMLESSGNMLNNYYQIASKDKEQVFDDNGVLEDSYYRFLDVRFSQYLKFDAIGVFSHHINASNTLAYRAQFGIGVPYGNSSQLPFEKRYFGGGANGIRAWMVRSLGPGTYSTTQKDYYNQSGDVNFVASAEYRFKLFKIVEGAVFTDVGNTWTIRDYEKQPGAVFEFDSFYKQIAAGIGAGIRLDLNFFVFRVDMGFKAFDPTKPYKQRWVLGQDLEPTTHIAIGYPF